MEETPAGEVICRIDRAKAALMVIGCVAFTAICGAMFIGLGTPTKPFWGVRTIGGIGFVFFGFCLAGSLQLLLSRAPGLFIDRKGIVDKTTYVSAGRVCWTDIRGLRLHSICGQTLVIIDLHHPGQFARRGNLLQRWLKGISMWLVGSPVSLSLASLNVRAEDLMRVLQRYFDRAMLPAEAPGFICHSLSNRIP